MVHFSSSDEWQRQSSLLLEARPTTTRITTKYNIPNLDSPKYQKARKRKRDAEGEAENATAAAPLVPRATLVLKTYDPESGVVLKFKTDRAAEVGRLFSGLGRVGRQMAGLPAKELGLDATVEDVQPAEEAPADPTVPNASSAKSTNTATTDSKGQSGGTSKKKRNKKK